MNAVEVKWGRVILNSVAVDVDGEKVSSVVVRIGQREIEASYVQDGARVLISLKQSAVINESESLEVVTHV